MLAQSYQRPLKISNLKFKYHNWLKGNSLVPENVEEMSKTSCSELIEKINCNYITNNKNCMIFLLGQIIKKFLVK